MTSECRIGIDTLALVNRAGTDRSAADELLDRVYDRLRRQAGRMIASDKAGRDMGATDLVHRAFMQCCIRRPRQWEAGSQFGAAFARTMQCVLIDHARSMIRRRNRLTPHPEAQEYRTVESIKDLDVVKLFSSTDPQLILDMRKAFEKLRGRDIDCHAVAYQRFFGCRTIAQIAADMKCSEKTVGRVWQQAKRYLEEFLTAMGYGAD